MSAGTHTPGPWQIKPSIEGGGLCIYAGEYGIGKAWDLNGQPENRANARLIAAAPELLAALKEAELAIGDWGRPTSANGMTTPHPNHPLFQAMRKAYAAIAKAEGLS